MYKTTPKKYICRLQQTYQHEHSVIYIFTAWGSSLQLILATLSSRSYRQPATYPCHTVSQLLPSVGNLSLPHCLAALTVSRQLILATLSRSSYRQPAILPHATFTPSMSNHIPAYLATAFDLLLPSAPLLFHSLHVSKPFQHTLINYTHQFSLQSNSSTNNYNMQKKTIAQVLL